MPLSRTGSRRIIGNHSGGISACHFLLSFDTPSGEQAFIVRGRPHSTPKQLQLLAQRNYDLIGRQLSHARYHS
ncbi:hypothetical protein K0M31_003584 [Melipona bicolor]|uniref:Uncharacterized protein n=1 Tax=Melipona bicolor TaxID=60889 RepID=A0AA40FZH4_9HYME|nr:hypothetical protein K0M31_003584 [Melipona bicolor]